MLSSGKKKNMYHSKLWFDLIQATKDCKNGNPPRFVQSVQPCIRNVKLGWRSPDGKPLKNGEPRSMEQSHVSQLVNACFGLGQNSSHASRLNHHWGKQKIQQPLSCYGIAIARGKKKYPTLKSMFTASRKCSSKSACLGFKWILMAPELLNRLENEKKTTCFWCVSEWTFGIKRYSAGFQRILQLILVVIDERAMSCPNHPPNAPPFAWTCHCCGFRNHC